MARELDDGSLEVAFRYREPDGPWSERAYLRSWDRLRSELERWAIPADAEINGWSWGARGLPLQPNREGEWGWGSGGNPRVILVARRTKDGRTEFGIRQSAPPGWSTGHIVLPQRRFFPANPSHDGWYVTSPITVSLTGLMDWYESESGDDRPLSDFSVFDWALARVLDYASVALGEPVQGERAPGSGYWTALSSEIQYYAAGLLTHPGRGTHSSCIIFGIHHLGDAAQALADAAELWARTGSVVDFWGVEGSEGLREEVISHIQAAMARRVFCYNTLI